LQHGGGGARAAHHRNVERDEVDATGQVLAADRVPEIGVIDVLCLVLGQVADVLGRDIGVAPGGESALGDAEIGWPAGVGRVVGEAAFVGEDEVHAFAEIAFHGAGFLNGQRDERERNDLRANRSYRARTDHAIATARRR